MSVATYPSDADRILDEWERRQVAGEPAGGRELRLAVACLELAGDMFDAWADRHPDGCGCRYCRTAGSIYNLRRDVVTAAGMASMTSSVLRSDVAWGLRADAETFGADLRWLAAESDAIDLMADDADEPVVVKGGAR